MTKRAGSKGQQYRHVLQNIHRAFSQHYGRHFILGIGGSLFSGKKMVHISGVGQLSADGRQAERREFSSGFLFFTVFVCYDQCL